MLKVHADCDAGSELGGLVGDAVGVGVDGVNEPPPPDDEPPPPHAASKAHRMIAVALRVMPSVVSIAYLMQT